MLIFQGYKFFISLVNKQVKFLTFYVSSFVQIAVRTQTLKGFLTVSGKLSTDVNSKILS